MVGGAVGLALARSLWSLGPAGQLFPGTVYQTLEVGDRPDSRISFYIPMLAANGNSPYGPVGASYYLPYTFSSRGPLAGLAATPPSHGHGSPSCGCRHTPLAAVRPAGLHGLPAHNDHLRSDLVDVALDAHPAARRQRIRSSGRSSRCHDPVLNPRVLVHLAEAARSLPRAARSHATHRWTRA